MGAGALGGHKGESEPPELDTSSCELPDVGSGNRALAPDSSYEWDPAVHAVPCFDSAYFLGVAHGVALWYFTQFVT